MAYGSKAGMELVYGAGNIDKWSDADNDGDATKKTNRVNWALARAENEINDSLRSSRYVIPFNPVPQTVTDYCNQLAGAILYRSPRAIVDGDDANAQVASMIDEYNTWIQRVQSGKVKLNATRPCNEGPRVVNHSADPDCVN